MGRSLPENTHIPDAKSPVWLGNGSIGTVTYREVARKLRALGCQERKRRGRGSHRKWFNPNTQQGTVVPDWGRT